MTCDHTGCQKMQVQLQDLCQASLHATVSGPETLWGSRRSSHLKVRVSHFLTGEMCRSDLQTVQNWALKLQIGGSRFKLAMFKIGSPILLSTKQPVRVV